MIAIIVVTTLMSIIIASIFVNMRDDAFVPPFHLGPIDRSCSIEVESFRRVSSSSLGSSMLVLGSIRIRRSYRSVWDHTNNTPRLCSVYVIDGVGDG